MIEVKTCARLHLGLLDVNGEQGRLYGSIGVAVNRPQLLLRAKESHKLVVEGLETGRVTTYAQRFMDRFGAPEGAHLSLLAGIPAHVGLGSGTQIALAVGTALARLAGLRLSLKEIAVAAGRGGRSGIGVAAFQHGGFILDGGHSVEHGKQAMDTRVPPVIVRHSLPKDWYFVTAVPGTGQGISGEKENNAFSRLPESSPEIAEKISWLILMQMLPAIVENNVAGFGKAMTQIQQIVGDCFASVQGGRFSNPVSGKLIEFLIERGAAGAGQSSWGPAVYGLVQGRGPARQLMGEAQAFLSDFGGGDVFCVQPQNRGAIIRSRVERVVSARPEFRAY